MGLEHTLEDPIEDGMKLKQIESPINLEKEDCKMTHSRVLNASKDKWVCKEGCDD